MHRILLVTALLLLLLRSASNAQNAPFNSVNGVTSNQINNPGLTVAQFGCSSGSTNWTYYVTALDVAGGSTNGTTASITGSSCASLSTTSYNLLSITAPIGAVTCNVYRTSPTGTNFNGRIATIPCGGGIVATYQDIGSNALDSTTATAINSTGSVKASGTVTALNFLSMGTSAGTSDWVQGSPLPLCSTGQTQPCIQPNSFFLQAPQGAITSFGWTAPITANTAGSAPLVVGQSSTTGVPTSTLSYGFPGTAGTVTVGNLATYTSSTGSIGNCTSLPCNSIIGVFNFYNPSASPAIPPSWISSGETMVNLDATVNVNAGDILCASATVAGTAHDNGSIACPTGLWVGIAKSSGSTSSPIAFIVLK